MWKNAKFYIKEAQLRVQYKLMKGCLFCKLIKGEIPTKPIVNSKDLLVIDDINPIAEVHILIIPKAHIESVLTVSEDDSGVIIKMFKAAQKLVADKKLKAFRLAFNGGTYQHVLHLHMHLVAGKKIEWSKL